MARQKSDAAEFIPFPTRFPKAMLAVIKALAAEGRRPINNQILILMEQALAQSEKMPTPPPPPTRPPRATRAANGSTPQR